MNTPAKFIRHIENLIALLFMQFPVRLNFIVRCRTASPAGISLISSGHHHHGHHHHHERPHKQSRPPGNPAADGPTRMDVDEESREVGKSRDPGRAGATRSPGRAEAAAVVAEEGAPSKGKGKGKGLDSGLRGVESEGGGGSVVDGGKLIVDRREGEKVAVKKELGLNEGDVDEDVDESSRAGTSIAKEGRASTSGPVHSAKEGDRSTEGSEGGRDMILAMAIFLIRHAMEDTFGKEAVTVDDTVGEIAISADGSRAKLRVTVSPPPPEGAENGVGSDKGEEARSASSSETAWRCEVVECTKQAWRGQITLLIERLRIAVSKS